MNKRIKNGFAAIIFLVSAIMIYGCTPKTDNESLQNNDRQALTFLPINSTTTPARTSSPIPISSPQEPLTTNTPVTPEEPLNENPLTCKPLIPILPDEIEYLPEAVYVQEYEMGFITYDPNSTNIIFDGYGFAAISPEHQTIALYAFDLYSLLILDSSGIIQTTFPIYGENTVLVDWIGPEEILFFKYDAEPVAAFIVNVTTLDIRHIALDFPDISQGVQQPGSNWNSIHLGTEINRLVITPQHEIVLYPSALGNYDSIGEVVLWDMENQFEITRIFGIDRFSTAPVFSPDGQVFVMDIMQTVTDTYIDRYSSNIFLIDLEGNREQLSDFKLGIRTKDFSWSSDSKKIAFWIDDVDKGRYLGVLNVNTKVLETYCVSGMGKIFWSQNDEYLLISSTDDFNFPSSVSIVNLKDGWVSRIFDEGEALGWVKNDSE